MAEPARTYGTLVTDIGVNLITQASMEGEKINITQIAVGDGGGSYYQPEPFMTALKNENWRGPINSVAVSEQSPNMIDIVAVIPSNVGGWTIREMAVFDEAENMIAICNTPDTEKVIITTGAAGEIEVTMHLEISNTGTISFVVDPSVITATRKDIEKHNTSAKAHEALFQKKAEVTDVNAHVNNSDIHVTADTMGNYDIAIAGLIAHTENQGIHANAAEKSSWNTAAQTAQLAADTAANAVQKTEELESRMARVEDGLFNNITGNPFLASFESLEGVTMTKGIWNAAHQRIEC